MVILVRINISIQTLLVPEYITRMSTKISIIIVLIMANLRTVIVMLCAVNVTQQLVRQVTTVAGVQVVPRQKS